MELLTKGSRVIGRDRVPSRRTASDRIYDQLRDEIMRGGIPVGSVLNPSEIAGHHEVSAIPVREALQRLTAEGLVASKAYGRYQVRELEDEAVLELVDIRSNLEAFALRGRSFTAEELARLAGLCHSMRSADDFGDWLELDKEFHGVMCGWDSEVAAMVRNLRDRIQQHITLAMGGADRRSKALDEHWEILASLQAGDMRGAELGVQAHIGQTRRALAMSLESRGASPASDREGAEQANRRSVTAM